MSEVTAEVTKPKVGELIPQPHGGALRNGGSQPHPERLPGRPPSAIRERLRGSFAERIKVLEEIADGEPVQKVRLPLAYLLPHVACPNCGELGVAAKEPKNVYLLQFEAHVSASPADRNKAVDLLGKYGLGTLKEISDEEVRDRLAATLREIQASLPKDEAEALIARIEKCWR